MTETSGLAEKWACQLARLPSERDKKKKRKGPIIRPVSGLNPGGLPWLILRLLFSFVVKTASQRPRWLVLAFELPAYRTVEHSPLFCPSAQWTDWMDRLPLAVCTMRRLSWDNCSAQALTAQPKSLELSVTGEKRGATGLTG